MAMVLIENHVVLCSYLSNKYQRTKINKSFSSWSKIVFGVPQGSALGPLLFNIYINDMFYMNELTYVCNSHTCNSSLENSVNRLEHDANLTVEWLEYNYMKLNEDKCHLIIAGHKSEAIWAKIG